MKITLEFKLDEVLNSLKNPVSASIEDAGNPVGLDNLSSEELDLLGERLIGAIDTLLSHLGG